MAANNIIDYQNGSLSAEDIAARFSEIPHEKLPKKWPAPLTSAQLEEQYTNIMTIIPPHLREASVEAMNRTIATPIYMAPNPEEPDQPAVRAENKLSGNLIRQIDAELGGLNDFVQHLRTHDHISPGRFIGSGTNSLVFSLATSEGKEIPGAVLRIENDYGIQMQNEFIASTLFERTGEEAGVFLPSMRAKIVPLAVPLTTASVSNDDLERGTLKMLHNVSHDRGEAALEKIHDFKVNELCSQMMALPDPHAPGQVLRDAEGKAVIILADTNDVCENLPSGYAGTGTEVLNALKSKYPDIDAARSITTLESAKKEIHKIYANLAETLQQHGIDAHNPFSGPSVHANCDEVAKDANERVVR